MVDRDTSRSLAALPPELRLAIFDQLFAGTTIEVKRGATQSEQQEDDDHNAEAEPTSTINLVYGISRPPVLSERLHLVCRLFNHEIGTRWHSQVTYRFPSTVAFIDVLSQWRSERVRTLRYAYIVGTTLPLYPWTHIGGYTTHLVADALPIFPGLALRTLVVENVWLRPTGEPHNGWCTDAYLEEVERLLQSAGWKEFRYLSPPLSAAPTKLRALDERVVKFHANRGEPDFAYGRAPECPRPEIARWYHMHPDLRPVPPVTVQVWGRRATNDYAENGRGLREPIKELLEHLSWVKLRQADKYLADDGVDDPSVHLWRL